MTTRHCHGDEAVVVVVVEEGPHDLVLPGVQVADELVGPALVRGAHPGVGQLARHVIVIFTFPRRGLAGALVRGGEEGGGGRPRGGGAGEGHPEPGGPVHPRGRALHLHAAAVEVGPAAEARQLPPVPGLGLRPRRRRRLPAGLGRSEGERSPPDAPDARPAPGPGGPRRGSRGATARGPAGVAEVHHLASQRDERRLEGEGAHQHRQDRGIARPGRRVRARRGTRRELLRDVPPGAGGGGGGGAGGAGRRGRARRAGGQSRGALPGRPRRALPRKPAPPERRPRAAARRRGRAGLRGGAAAARGRRVRLRQAHRLAAVPRARDDLRREGAGLGQRSHVLAARAEARPGRRLRLPARRQRLAAGGPAGRPAVPPAQRGHLPGLRPGVPRHVGPFAAQARLPPGRRAQGGVERGRGGRAAAARRAGRTGRASRAARVGRPHVWLGNAAHRGGPAPHADRPGAPQGRLAVRGVDGLRRGILVGGGRAGRGGTGGAARRCRSHGERRECLGRAALPRGGAGWSRETDRLSRCTRGR